MGTLRNGGNGAFSGKAGSFIGSSWRGISYMRGLPKLSKKPASERQLMQQAKFKTAVDFLQPLKKLMEQGFKSQKAGNSTGYNTAFQLLMAEAMAGEYPNYYIDCSKVSLAKGGHGRVVAPQIHAHATQPIVISWFPETNKQNAFNDDQAVIILYNSNRNLFLVSEGEVTRGVGRYEKEIPVVFSGDTFHAWIYFTPRDGSVVSHSDYVGAVTIA